VREVVRCETHSGDAPAAVVAERAELLHHQAAFDTQQERDRFQLAAHAYETALLQQRCESQRLAARRAASTALSEQINSNLLGRLHPARSLLSRAWPRRAGLIRVHLRSRDEDGSGGYPEAALARRLHASRTARRSTTAVSGSARS